jgi:hypothetical protein
MYRHGPNLLALRLRIGRSPVSSAALSVSRISPGRNCQPVADRDLASRSLSRGIPLLPGRGVVLVQIGVAKKAYGVLEAAERDGDPDAWAYASSRATSSSDRLTLSFTARC